ncbi:gamma-glutamyl-gamma-aminobutyrate hydrolase family protein [Thermodesulfobacteriota bacterium]
MSRTRILVALILVFSLLRSLAPATAIGPDEAPLLKNEPEALGPVEASSTWIVVNLFTGRSSKQAVRVRDTFRRLRVGGRGIVLPYKDITVANMLKMRPAFLALSPNGIPWCRYRGKNKTYLEAFLKDLRVIVEQLNIPVIGICGGHQALALAFGGKVGPIRGGEDDCFPYGKNPTERGRRNIYVTQDDPLFEGMGPSLNLVQNHYDEVKRLPQGFLWLAENKLSPHQIIRHPTKPAYGVQAHTEYFYKARPDGGTLLKNFLRIANTHNELVRKPGLDGMTIPAVQTKRPIERSGTLW